VPVLLLTGSDSHDPSKADIETVAAALPDALILVIEGQEHVADVLVPQVFADHILGSCATSLKAAKVRHR
jgi:hypothetical protein